MKTLKDLNVENKKVIIRVDFNVPIKEGKIVDDTRIVGALKTINYCLEHNSKVILLSSEIDINKRTLNLKVSDEVLPDDMSYAWSGTTLQEIEASGQLVAIMAIISYLLRLFVR